MQSKNLYDTKCRQPSVKVGRFQRIAYTHGPNTTGNKIVKYTKLRRLHAETFKIMNGLSDVNRKMFFKLDVSGRRGHNMKLFKRRFRLDIRKFVFSKRVVDHWNVLPQCSINCNSINTF